MPDRITQMIGTRIPLPVLQAEMDAEFAASDAARYHAPVGAALLRHEDQADREQALAELHRANKTLAAHNPGLIVTPKAVTA
ncbi:hypothetical protein ACIRD2_03350 [Streptomyces sp. NPDC093595]|uniref:hypothetical protein n=1 Tax=Streptomyces sp. NPDC093595 TaxID=3366045 RepID=UPI00381EFB63